MAGSVTATWSGSNSRQPTAYTAGPPPLSPLAVSVDNTPGQWLFAIVSWRQDAITSGTNGAGVLTYPSTVTVSDDAGNFWIPAGGVPPGTGVVRCSVWMAPAARAAEYVFVSPNAYQSGLAVVIMQVLAACPWYEVSVIASGYTNQGSSLSVTQGVATDGLFTVGAYAWDTLGMLQTITSTGWTSSTVVQTSNDSDTTGDMAMYTYYATTSGSELTLSGVRASGVPAADFGCVIVTVHGASDPLAFPYTVPEVENWPVLITEIAAGPVLNANPDMAGNVTNWTGQNATIAYSAWPVYQQWPSYQALNTGSLELTPSGSQTFAGCYSEEEAVSPVVQYTALAFVYSAAGYSDCSVFINWFNSGGTYLSTSTGTVTNVLAGTWTGLSFSAPVFPPATAAYGACGVQETAASGDVPSSAILYAGYCGFGPADAYEDVPQDQVAWTDVSTRNFTQDSIKISRGIQYEQQSLKAGTMTVNLANNDGAMMFGNILSAYWPTIGDTDVPVRLRAVWPQSLTPYSVLFSGFTDEIEFGWDSDEGTWYGYAAVEASDAWSRLTSQMLGAAEQEILEDDPFAYFTCSQSGTNIALGNVTPVTQADSVYGPGSAVASFTSSAITPVGDSGASCWQSQSTSPGGYQGVALTYFPPATSALPPVTDGLTLSFVMSPQALSAGQPDAVLTVCTCWSRKGPMWTISIDNTGGEADATASVTVYDQSTGAGTTTSVGVITYLGPDSAPLAWQLWVTFSQSTLTVVSTSQGGALQNTVTVSCNLAGTAVGMSWGGNAGPITGNNYGSTPGFMNVAVYGIAIFGYIVCPARLAAQHQTQATANPSETDTARLARIAGYAGATPAVLAMRCLDLAAPPAPDLDLVTAATDTYGQVTSDYFTNIASSTLAFMFVPGTGVLIYRRPLEAYDRALPQWALGEYAPYALNSNGSFYPAAAGWTVASGATLTPVVFPSGHPGPLFTTAGQFHGNGSTAGAEILWPSAGYSAGVPVAAGEWFRLTAAVYSVQGWATGISATLLWYTSGGSEISGISSDVIPLAAGPQAWLDTGIVQAPATAAFATIAVSVSGTPASTVVFNVSAVTLSEAYPVAAGGAGAAAPEVPYRDDVKLSSDRALLFNQAVLTQYGTDTATSYTGSDLVFQPTSGILVTIQNTPSVTLRAGVPYTATIYLNNTAQALPYYYNDPSMEDFGNWITQTLAAPLMRPESVTITPAATPQAMVMGLQAEVGDTVSFRRRPQTGGAPEIQILTYCSKLTHTINVERGQWETEYEISPFQQGVVLACDAVYQGTLTGGNLIGL